MTNKEKSLEQWCRRQLLRNNVRLAKSRKQISLNNYGGYQLVDQCRNMVLDGSNFELSLNDVKWRIENFNESNE